MSILTRQKAKLRSECEETIADPSNHAKLKVASRLRDANPVQEAHEVLDFVITAALAISELTTEVKCTRDTVLQNVEQDEATTVKILEQMISAEKRKEVESYLTSLSSADSTVERAVAMFTLPHDNDFGQFYFCPRSSINVYTCSKAETDIILGESSDAGGEDQLCLLTGPATLGISR